MRSCVNSIVSLCGHGLAFGRNKQDAIVGYKPRLTAAESARDLMERVMAQVVEYAPNGVALT